MEKILIYSGKNSFSLKDFPLINYLKEQVNKKKKLIYKN